MAISNAYKRVLNIEDNDIFLGTRAANRKTANYTAYSVADYLNSHGKVSVAGQMNWKFVTTSPKQGTVTFINGGGSGTAFASIDKLRIAVDDLGGQRVVEFLQYIVGADIIIAEQKELSYFGHYKITGYEPDAEVGYYIIELLHKGGSGLIVGEAIYDMALFNPFSEAASNASLQDVVTIGKTADEIELLFKVINGGQLNGDYAYIVSSAIDPIDSSKTYVYGGFDGIDGVPSARIARINYDGSIDESFAVGQGLNGYPYGGSAIIVDNAGNVYVPGSFTTYNGTSANRIVSLTQSGSININFQYGSGFNGFTLATAFNIAQTHFYVTGLYSSYNGVGTNRIIKLALDGTSDASFAYGSGFNNTSVGLLINTDDSLFVTGYFSLYNGVSANKIIKLLPSGLKDVSFNPGSGFNTGNNQPNLIFRNSQGQLICYGYFTSYNGVPANRVISILDSGAVNTSLDFGSGFNGMVSEIFQAPDGRYVAFGAFTEYNGTATAGIIILNENLTVNATFEVEYSFPFINGSKIYAVSNSGQIFDLSTGVPTIDKKLTFNKNTGRAEYNITTIEGASDYELLNKKLIAEAISDGVLPAIGYTPADDSDVVHLTGDETISGNKTFTGSTTFSTSEVFGRETILTASVSDNATDKFLIANGTTTSTRFIPTFVGYAGGAYQSLLFRGLGSSANDLVGTAPYAQFLAANTSSSTDPNNGVFNAPTARRLFSWGTVNNDYLTLTATGNILIGTTVDNGSDLQVNGTATFSSCAGGGDNKVVVASADGTLSTKVGYKVYTAIISQSGSSAPTITSFNNLPLENTLGGTIVWTRIGIGSYRGTLNGAFTLDKTHCSISNGFFQNAISIAASNTNIIALSTSNDGLINEASIEIRVYN